MFAVALIGFGQPQFLVAHGDEVLEGLGVFGLLLFVDDAETVEVFVQDGLGELLLELRHLPLKTSKVLFYVLGVVVQGRVVEGGVVQQTQRSAVALEYQLEYLVQDLVGLHWPLQEVLDDAGEEHLFEPGLVGVELLLVLEVLLEQVGSLLDVLRECPEYPDQRFDGSRFIDVVPVFHEALAYLGQQLGVLPEDLVETEDDFVGEMGLSEAVVGVDVDEQGLADFWEGEGDAGESLH